jgi:hypothetical protein
MWYNGAILNRKVDRRDAQTSGGLGSCAGGTLTMSNHTLDASSVKVCFICKQELPLSSYSKNKKSKDGLFSYCKPCARVRQKQWRESNIETRKDYMRQWHKENLEHETAYKRTKYQTDPEYRQKVLDWQKVYRQTAEARKVHYEYKKRRGFANDETRAHTTVNRAVRRGLLPKASTQVCSVCGGKADHWHHHVGYEREHWLDVVAVCAPCHVAIHANEVANE